MQMRNSTVLILIQTVKLWVLRYIFNNTIFLQNAN